MIIDLDWPKAEAIALTFGAMGGFLMWWIDRGDKKQAENRAGEKEESDKDVETAKEEIEERFNRMHQRVAETAGKVEKLEHDFLERKVFNAEKFLAKDEFRVSEEKLLQAIKDMEERITKNVQLALQAVLNGGQAGN